jgi:hypothetical protein
MLPPIERWRFTGRSRWNEMGAIGYLKLDVLLQTLKIDLPFSIKGSRYCRPNPFKSFESHLSTLPFLRDSCLPQAGVIRDLYPIMIHYLYYEEKE